VRLYPSFSRQFYSHLAPAEVAGILQASTLPLANDSWRDDFIIHPTQPFQGVVDAESFHIIRLRTGQIRRASPLQLAGRVEAAHSKPGSQVLLGLRLSKMELVVNGIAWIVALALVAATLFRERLGFGLIHLGGLLYLLIPTCLTAAQYVRLRNEAAVYEQLLGPLLGLFKQQ
jgi:hypothetical protein